GVLQNTAPNPSAAPPKLVVKFNGKVRSLVPIPPSSLNSTSKEDTIHSDGHSDGANDSKGGDLLDEVGRFYEKSGGDETDQENGPDWMFEDGKLTSQDPEYIFCPAPHRKQLLHLLTKHYCQHPLLAEKDGKWDMARI
ncbi:hypothetical protein H0H87_006271, partial [Tephrocybe sp. NHM501043]